MTQPVPYCQHGELSEYCVYCPEIEARDREIAELRKERDVWDLGYKMRYEGEASAWKRRAEHAEAQIAELRTPLADWDKKLTEKNAALSKRKARIMELEAALGRAHDDITQGYKAMGVYETRAECAEAKIETLKEAITGSTEAICRAEKAEARLAAVLSIVEGSPCECSSAAPVYCSACDVKEKLAALGEKS